MVTVRLPLQHPPKGPESISQLHRDGTRSDPSTNASPCSEPTAPGGERSPERHSGAKKAAQLEAGLPHLPQAVKAPPCLLVLARKPQGFSLARSSESQTVNQGESWSSQSSCLAQTQTHTRRPLPAAPAPAPPKSSFLVEMKLRYPSWPLGGTFRPCTWLHTPLKSNRKTCLTFKKKKSASYFG